MKELDAKNLGKAIRKYRIEKGMTQKELGACIYRGGKYIGHIEQGSRVPSLGTLVTIVNALGVGFDQVLYASLESHPYDQGEDLNELLGGLNKKERKKYVDLIRFLIEQDWK